MTWKIIQKKRESSKERRGNKKGADANKKGNLRWVAQGKKFFSL